MSSLKCSKETHLTEWLPRWSLLVMDYNANAVGILLLSARSCMKSVIKTIENVWLENGNMQLPSASISKEGNWRSSADEEEMFLLVILSDIDWRVHSKDIYNSPPFSCLDAVLCLWSDRVGLVMNVFIENYWRSPEYICNTAAPHTGTQKAMTWKFYLLLL